MKRSVLVASSMIILCGLLLLPTALVNAYYAGYQTTNYLATETPVIDGNWTTPTEWNDAQVPTNLSATFNWRNKWTYPVNIMVHFLIEFFTDNTNDTDDYFQFCLDRLADGGLAPQLDDIRIDYVGHIGLSGLKVYEGNGTGWQQTTNFTWPTEINIQESISPSSLNSTPHWIIEFTMDRTKWDTQPSTYQPWIRVAVFDASNATAGVQAWPPTSRDVPNDWGLEIGLYQTIPEPLTIGAIVVLSSVAVAVSFYCLRRRPKTVNHVSGEIT